MTFKNGKVIEATANNTEKLNSILDTDDGARFVGEFAIGFNPLLAIPTSGDRWIPYYGYGAGVVRLSLGDNTELGGRVGGGYVRWNFFTDATVSVGGNVWVSGGKMTTNPSR